MQHDGSCYAMKPLAGKSPGAGNTNCLSSSYKSNLTTTLT